MSRLKLAYPTMRSARKSTPHMTKEFAFKQIFRNSTTVNYDKRTSIAL